MATGVLFRSDLYNLHDVVQNSMTLYPKELVISTLRDFFSRDSWYHFTKDAWGFPKTPELTNIPLTGGLHNDSTTRLFIGESYRFDVIYYPALIVRHGGSTSVPISINRETSGIKWGNIVYQDGYGNIKLFPTPEHYIFAGAWEGSINIDIMARDIRARDDLVDLVSILFTDIAYNDLQKSGLAIKGVSSGGPTETDDRNDHIFRQTVSLQIRSEWRRNIPIKSVIEVINLSVEFGRLDPTGPIAPNLTINTNESLTDMLLSL